MSKAPWLFMLNRLSFLGSSKKELATYYNRNAFGALVLTSTYGDVKAFAGLRAVLARTAGPLVGGGTECEPLSN